MSNFPLAAAALAARQKALAARLRADDPPKPPDPAHWAVQRLAGRFPVLPGVSP